MGIKGDKHSEETAQGVALLLNALSAIEDVTSKKMFGGYGIFFKGKMFALFSAKGKAYFKANETNLHEFEPYGTEQHSRMPYYFVPPSLYKNTEEIIRLARTSIATLDQ
jgi:DNA transformation protein